MRAHEDREVMYHMLRTKADDELTLRVWLTRKLIHQTFSEKIRSGLPLVSKFKDAKGEEKLINLANREELWNVRVVQS